MNNTFNKRLMVVSSWAPGAPGASPLFFYGLFSRFNKDSYVMFTEPKWANASTMPGRLPCRHFAFGKEGASFIEKVIRGLNLIRAERIEILLGVADKGPALLLTLTLSLLSGKPYAVYLLDLYRWNRFGMLRDLFAHIFEPILFSRASAIFVMGEGHKRLYERKYGDRFTYIVIRNCPNSESRKVVPPKTPTAPYRIVYTGSVYWAQEKSIQNLISAVNAMGDIDIRIELYAPRGLERMKEEQRGNSRVFFGGNISHTESERIQSEADILFLPLAWNAPSKEVVEMAVPGKTAEYLASGRPILVHAPPWSYLAVYAKEKGFATVVDAENSPLLAEGIRNILNNPEVRESLMMRALSVFKEEYDAAKNAEKLRAGLNAI